MPNNVHVVMDLRHLFDKEQSDAEDTNKAENSDTVGVETTEEEEDAKVAKKLALKDWEQELERRLANNAKKDPSHKKSDGEVKNKFWKAYFKANWKPEVAKKLYTIDLLKTDIESMGFDPLINPLLAFVLRNYTQKLVLDGLINSETFKALNNAVARDYLADSEFVQENEYNILYCRDLYRLPAKDILEYLKIQKEILKPSAPTYNKQTKTTNIKVFLENGNTSVLDVNAKLNSLEEVKKFVGKITGKNFDEEKTDDAASNGKKSTLSRADLVKVVNNLVNNTKGNSGILAALQYIGMTTGASEAFEAIKRAPKNVSAEELLSETPTVSKYLKKVSLDKSTVSSLIELFEEELGI